MASEGRYGYKHSNVGDGDSRVKARWPTRDNIIHLSDDISRRYHVVCRPYYKRYILNIIFVGRLIFAKGVQDLIAACGTLWREGYDVKLVIVGGGPYAPEIDKLATKEIGDLWKGTDRTFIKWEGELDHAGVMKALKESDIFVNPSYSEGLPTSVMEAASVGLPIIATDVGGTREIINEISGFLYNPHDVISLTHYLRVLIDDPIMRATFGANAKKLVAEKFNWDKITDQYEKLLKEVVG